MFCFRVSAHFSMCAFSDFVFSRVSSLKPHGLGFEAYALTKRPIPACANSPSTCAAAQLGQDRVVLSPGGLSFLSGGEGLRAVVVFR